MSKAQGIAQSANQGNFKNRIINGAMVFDQRNNGSSVTANGSTYVYQLDRFYSGGLNGSGAFTVQRVTDAPPGFSNSVRMTITTPDTSLAYNEEYGFQQTIEGNNVFDFAWGTANAQPVTLSFWVKSSLTGTFGVGIRNAGTWNRSYVGQYTINAANTWEYKTISITGETTGTWGTGNSSSVNVAFDFGGGSNFNGTANTWNTAGATRVSGNVSLIGTNGATWQVTGVQLEKGSTATSFDYRPYGTELQLAQRYFTKLNNDGSGGDVTWAIGMQQNSTTSLFHIAFPVPMRAEPTITTVSTNATDLIGWGSTFTLASAYMGYLSGMIAGTHGSNGATYRPVFLRVDNNTSGSLSLSAEL